MLIKKSKPKIQNFMIIAVISALTIINAFAGSAKAR
jgi:hypothetical protein